MHDDKQIKIVQEYIENNFNQRITVESLADKYAISRRNFIRRFKNATQSTPIEYIQRVKVEAAKKEYYLNKIDNCKNDQKKLLGK